MEDKTFFNLLKQSKETKFKDMELENLILEPYLRVTYNNHCARQEKIYEMR